MKMTIVKKMIVLIATSAIGLAALGWFALESMETVYDKANFGNVNSVPSIQILDEAAVSFGRLRVRVYRHVLNNDEAKMAEIEVKIKEAQEALSAALKKYEVDGCLGKSCIADDKDKQLFADVVSSYKEYLVGVPKVLQFSREQKNDQALATLMQYAEPAEKLNAALQTDMDYNTQLAKKGADEAVSAKTNATRMVIMVAGSILAFAVILGWFVARGIILPLNELKRVVEALAQGDFTVNVNVDSEDEIGVVANSLQEMRLQLVEVVQQVRTNSDALGSASQEISATAQALSQSATEQASGVEQTTTSIEELN
ncbi:MAG: methyl-accepting chemotaxis protein, partial [Methylobacter sp.]